MHFWAELGPKTINIPGAREGFPPRAGKVRFLQNDRKFLKFHETSSNSANFPERRAAGAPENEKVDLALYRCPFRVVIFASKTANSHDFHEKVQFS